MPLALPGMLQEFKAQAAVLGTTPTIVWSIIAYMIPFAAVLVPAARLADLYGHRKLFLAGLAIYTIFTLASGLAWDVYSLLAFRLVQGVGGGIVFVVSMQMLGLLFPGGEASSAISLGIWRGVVVGASVLSPSVGGPLTVLLGWRSVSWAMAPFGVLNLLLAWLILRETRGLPAVKKVDWVGALSWVMGCSFIVLGMALTRISGATAYTYGSYAAGFVLLLLLPTIEEKHTERMVPLELFANRTYLASSFATMIVCVGMFTIMMFVPFFMLFILKYSLIQASLAVVPASIAAIGFSYISGWLVPRLGNAVTSSTGFLVVAAGLFMLSRLSPSTNYAYIFIALLLTGIGMSLPLAPTTVAALNAVPANRVADASGIFNTFHNFGRPIGVGLIGGILVISAVESYNAIFLLATLVSIVAAIVSLALGGRPSRTGTEPKMVPS